MANAQQSANCKSSKQLRAGFESTQVGVKRAMPAQAATPSNSGTHTRAIKSANLKVTVTNSVGLHRKQPLKYTNILPVRINKKFQNEGFRPTVRGSQAPSSIDFDALPSG